MKPKPNPTAVTMILLCRSKGGVNMDAKELKKEFTEYFTLHYGGAAKKTSWHFLNFVAGEYLALDGNERRDYVLKMSYRLKEWCARVGLPRSWENACAWWLACESKRKAK